MIAEINMNFVISTIPVLGCGQVKKRREVISFFMIISSFYFRLHYFRLDGARCEESFAGSDTEEK